MSWLESAIGVVGNIWGTNQSNSAAFEMQANSLKAQKEALQNKHQWEVTDLKKAGLNPILSANSAGGGISGATANITPYDIAGGLLAGANSAQARKATELMEKELEVRQTNADANMKNADSRRLEAENDIQKTANDTARTNSSVALNTSQIGVNNTYVKYYSALTDNTINRTKLETAMNKAQISEIQQRIINATLETGAKIEYYKASGQAALMGASAQQQQAAAQQIIADTARENGISQRQLNDALTEKGRAETAEALSRAANIDWQTRKDRAHNQYADTAWTDPFAGTLMRAGETIKTLNPLSGWFK